MELDTALAQRNDGGEMSDQHLANEQRAYPSAYSLPENVGLTKRELFAGMAMQGFCANPAVFQPNPMSGWSLANCDEEQLSKYSKKMADALLSALRVSENDDGQ
jgi:hypothetical protein